MKLLELTFFLQLWVQVRLSDDTLVLIHFIGRHCERTPDLKELHPKNPYYNESSFAPNGYGRLTNIGKRRCYDVGRALRQRYNGFLNASYHYTLVEGRTTHYDRTKESLLVLLAGLFPPTPELIWLEGMNWLPFAINSGDIEHDEILYSWGTQRHKQEFNTFLQTKEGKAITDPFLSLVENVSNQYNDSLDFIRVAYLMRGFELMEGFGLPVPDWLRSIYHQLEPIIAAYIRSSIGSQRLLRMSSGYLVSKIIADTEMKLNGTLDPINRKLFVYMGHDTTLIPLLTILDLWDNSTVPPPSSYCIIEIHLINGTYGFKFFMFNNASEGQIMSIPGFGEFVPLDKFKVHKRQFLELDDLDEPSFSTRLIGNLPYILIFSFVVLGFTL